MALIQVSGCILANILSIFVLLKKINDNRQFMSSRTFEMHRQLTISLGVQVSVVVWRNFPDVFWIFWS
jgi:hypothetical protein